MTPPFLERIPRPPSPENLLHPNIPWIGRASPPFASASTRNRRPSGVTSWRDAFFEAWIPGPRGMIRAGHLPLKE